ncbi:hypothetical protein AFLA_000540 [Aspergillus flavus NRRL3357]|nr:hypothetical protein AFLA_000540 [Aspergillus flavus NRRL3357]
MTLILNTKRRKRCPSKKKRSTDESLIPGTRTGSQSLSACTDHQKNLALSSKIESETLRGAQIRNLQIPPSQPWSTLPLAVTPLGT